MPNMSLLGFISHLASVQTHLQAHTAHAMDQAAKLVQDEAKKELGTYQTAAGPFAGWAELAQSTKDDRVRQGYSENDPGLRSGAARDSIERSSDHQEAAIGSDKDELVWFELGTSKQPPRSVLGTAAVHKEQEIVHVLGQAVHTALIGGGVVQRSTDDKALERQNAKGGEAEKQYQDRQHEADKEDGGKLVRETGFPPSILRAWRNRFDDAIAPHEPFVSIVRVCAVLFHASPYATLKRL